MKKLGKRIFNKRVAAAALAFTSILSHGQNSLALTKNQKIAAAVAGGLGGTAVFAILGYLILGQSEDDLVENMTKEELQEELEKLKIKVDSEYSPKNYSGNFDLSEKGKIFISNPIFDINTKNVNKDTLRQYLKELCKKTKIKKGVEVEVEDKEDGWEQSAWEYFFVENRDYAYSNMYEYRKVTEYHRRLLAKCILIMHQHMNDPKWKDVIYSVVLSLSSHGGHCDWRTVSLIYSSYRTLLKFLHEKGIVNSSVDPMGQEFAFFKEAMTADLMPIALEFIKKKVMEEHHGQEGDNPEYLDDVNNAILGFEYLTGVPVDQPKSKAVEYGKVAFNEMFKYENLVKISHNMADSLNQNKFFELINRTSISFNEFCEYTMKSKEQVKEMLDTIWSENDNDNKKLRQWVRGKLKLGAQQIVKNLVGVEYFDGLDKPYGVAWIICCIKNGYLVPKQN